jgi:DNA mismatch endonuclease (patch repair protein)
MPTSNRGWWEAKLARNRARDADTDAHLRALGWSVVRVWEHDDPSIVADHVAELLA